jgi:plasmid stabilization system protein ParE
LTDVNFSPRAEADIRLIAERLAEESELKSSIFRSRLADAVRSLSIVPERGRKRYDLSLESVMYPVGIRAARVH